MEQHIPVLEALLGHMAHAEYLKTIATKGQRRNLKRIRERFEKAYAQFNEAREILIHHAYVAEDQSVDVCNSVLRFLPFMREALSRDEYNTLHASLLYARFSADEKDATLRQAVNYAQRIEFKHVLHAYEHARLGSVFVNFADILQGEEAFEAYERGINHHTRAVEIERNAQRLYTLGCSLGAYAEVHYDCRKRARLRERALDALLASYALEKDEDTRLAIEELEEL